MADSSPGGTAFVNQYTIQVPSGATQLKIDVNGNTDLDLYVRFGSVISFENGFPVADFKSISDNFNESITITPASSPAATHCASCPTIRISTIRSSWSPVVRRASSTTW